MIHGTGNLKGLAENRGHHHHRRAWTTRAARGWCRSPSRAWTRPDVVTKLRERGIRTHTRKADHYSGNILTPLGLDAAIRVSMCHYNTEAEVAQFLQAIREIAEGVQAA